MIWLMYVDSKREVNSGRISSVLRERFGYGKLPDHFSSAKYKLMVLCIYLVCFCKEGEHL